MAADQAEIGPEHCVTIEISKKWPKAGPSTFTTITENWDSNEKAGFVKNFQFPLANQLEYDRNQVNQEPNQVQRSGEILKAVPRLLVAL